MKKHSHLKTALERTKPKDDYLERLFAPIEVEADATKPILIRKCTVDFCNEPESRSSSFCDRHRNEWMSSTEQRRYCAHIARRPAAAATALADFVRRVEFEFRNGAK